MNIKMHFSNISFPNATVEPLWTHFPPLLFEHIFVGLSCHCFSLLLLFMFPFALKWYFFFIKCTSREICFHSSVDKIILLYPHDPLFLSWYHAPVSKSPPHMIDFASNIFLMQTILRISLFFSAAFVSKLPCQNTNVWLCSEYI